MELRYSTTRSLIARWYWRSLWHNRRHQAIWLVCVLMAFALGAGQRPDHPLLTGLIGSAVMIALLALGPLVLFKPQERVLRLGPDGIQTTIGTKSGEISWREVARVERDGDEVIVTGRNLNAFIVPVTAFASEAECREAVGQWQAWQRAAASAA